MVEVNIPEMMEAGAHFGHQTKRWNPKMRPYIYGARSGVHIINLQKTKELANNALKYIVDSVASGKSVLFVGTKQQARKIIKDQAIRSSMHYVNQRWMGGTLTNFKTIKKSIDRLIDLETKREKNDFEGYTKRELLDVDRTITKLEASLGGIKTLNDVPELVFVIDPMHEKIAVRESKKLGIPIIAITDSNCDPDVIDHVIPGNDDAIASIEYFTTKIAEACLTGLEKREEIVREKSAEEQAEKPAKKQVQKRVAKGTEETKDQKVKTAYVARIAKPEFEGDAAEGFSAKVEKAAAKVSDKAIIEESEIAKEAKAEKPAKEASEKKTAKATKTTTAKKSTDKESAKKSKESKNVA